MTRPGHHRPLGTTTVTRLAWEGDGEPELGDVAFETYGPEGDPEATRRAFLVVGVEEPARVGGRWRLTLERLDWTAAAGRALDDLAHWWTFYRCRA